MAAGQDYCLDVEEFRTKARASYTVVIGPDVTMPEIIFDPD